MCFFVSLHKIFISSPLNICYTIREIRKYVISVKKQGKTIGFVPTMGALHHGHVSLVKRAKEKSHVTIVSIFVNPLQFNDKKDLKRYPRTLKADIELLKKAGCNAIFAPPVEEIYPKTKNKRQRTEKFDLGNLSKVMEGIYRPGHFEGVCTVVKKLLDIIEPTHAYFGEKDFQQLVIIKHMVKTLKIPVEIVSCPTVREADGLAMSSRNIFLTPKQRKSAPFIYKTLVNAKFIKGTIAHIKNRVKEQINSIPGFELEYFEIVNAETLQPVCSVKEAESLRACIAVKVGSVRLIDNIPF